jgi:sortase A
MYTWMKLRALEYLCWTAGLGLLLTFAGGKAFGEYERQQAIAAFAGAKSALSASATGGTRPAGQPGAGTPSWVLTPAAPDRADWSPARIRKHAEAQADPLLPVALLRIPRVALEVPVYPDVGERNLNRGAGLVDAASAADSDGNIAIAAHRDGYFRALSRVRLGDVVELDSMSGQRRYRIDALSVVDPHDLSPLQATAGPALTLVTCYPFWFVGNAPQRYIVRAVAVQ